MKMPFTTLFLFLTFLALGQTIPSERLTDWSKAGLIESTSAPEVVNVSDFGFIQDGSAPNDDLLNLIPGWSTGDPVVLFFPEGTYRFEQTIQLNAGQGLQGFSAEETRLEFDLGGNHHLIEANGETIGAPIPISQDLSRGNTTISLSQVSDIQEGDYLEIRDQDGDLVTSDWALGSTGQIVRVAQVANGIITIDSPLRRDFLVKNQAQVIRIDPISHLSIESLGLIRLDSTETQTSHIFWNYVVESSISCIESYFSNFAHVDLRHTARCEVSGNYFQEAFRYGGGGQGYGVVLQFASGENLIVDNSFKTLRHSILLQAGANGNVVTYNFSTDPFWTEVSLPEDAAGELVLHGNYPYANLFEGNTLQNLVIDDSHGINGPWNTFLRNRTLGYGIVMSPMLPSDQQNILGNEVLNNGMHMITGQDQYEQGNIVNGAVVPTGSGSVVPQSFFYLDSLPSWGLAPDLAPIGPPNEPGLYSINAEIRFQEGRKTACEDELTTVQHVTHQDPCEAIETSFLFNHSAPWSEHIRKVELYQITGQKLQEWTTNLMRSTAFPPGIYVVVIWTEQGACPRKIWLP